MFHFINFFSFDCHGDEATFDTLSSEPAPQTLSATLNPPFSHEPKVFEIKDTTVKISVEQKSLFSPRTPMVKRCGFCAALRSCAASIGRNPSQKRGLESGQTKADSLHPRRRYDRGSRPGEARVTA